MRRFSARSYSFVLKVVSVLAVPAFVQAADTVRATTGAQSEDLGNQALAFLPNELWVHAGDSVTWRFPTPELHTVTFLVPNQVRPPFPTGCPGVTPTGTSFTGASCVNSGVLIGGATYTVQFPSPGNFRLVCLVHADMTGTVHVLDLSQTLPQAQEDIDRQARDRQSELLSDAARLKGRGTSAAEQTSRNEVTAGISEIVATGGGIDTSSVMRFLKEKIEVRVGDTVEWTNLSTVNHTVTFGAEPANPAPPSAGISADEDGALHAFIGASGDSVNSGFLHNSPQERVGLPQSPVGPTRFRVTFTAPGTFRYICALHDDLGMAGTVVVHP